VETGLFGSVFGVGAFAGTGRAVCGVIDHAEIGALGGAGFGSSFGGLFSSGDEEEVNSSGPGVAKGLNSVCALPKRNEGSCSSIPPTSGSRRIGRAGG